MGLQTLLVVSLIIFSHHALLIYDFLSSGACLLVNEIISVLEKNFGDYAGKLLICHL